MGKSKFQVKAEKKMVEKATGKKHKYYDEDLQKSKGNTGIMGLILIIVIVGGGSFGAYRLIAGNNSGGVQTTTTLTTYTFITTNTYTTNPQVKLQTDIGDIVIELYPEYAPITVNNFISLVNDGFYDGLIFHRIIPDFMAQGGCPYGTGTGGPGYTIPDEVDPATNPLTHDTGRVSMANTGEPDTGGSQFFICYNRENTAHLDGHHTVFGQVISGMAVVNNLVNGTVILAATQIV